jgi:hypothetical protein
LVVPQPTCAGGYAADLGTTPKPLRVMPLERTRLAASDWVLLFNVVPPSGSSDL